MWQEGRPWQILLAGRKSIRWIVAQWAKAWKGYATTGQREIVGWRMGKRIGKMILHLKYRIKNYQSNLSSDVVEYWNCRILSTLSSESIPISTSLRTFEYTYSPSSSEGYLTLGNRACVYFAFRFGRQCRDGYLAFTHKVPPINNTFSKIMVRGVPSNNILDASWL